MKKTYVVSVLKHAAITIEVKAESEGGAEIKALEMAKAVPEKSWDVYDISLESIKVKQLSE